jgi:hypothetical protein
LRPRRHGTDNASNAGDRHESRILEATPGRHAADADA